MSIVFLAISRTGDDPARHDMFEVAAVQHRVVDGKAVERVHYWAIRPERLAGANPDELMRSRFYDRSAGWDHNASPVVAIDPSLGTTKPSSHGGVARLLARMLLGAQLATFGIDREAEFVAEFLRGQREPAAWAGHLDVASAAAGRVAGYVRGWFSRGLADGAPTVAPSIDVAAAALPLDPFRLAAALGVQPAGDGVSALVRACLARDMWASISASLKAGEAPVEPSSPPAVPPVSAPAPADALPPGVAPVVDPRDPLGLGGPSTGDVDLDNVIRGIGRPLD